MLIGQMVGRNESRRFLRPVLEHLLPIVDKLCFTDDASDDDTADVAESYGAHVFQMDEPTFVENEYLLRSTAWKHLENYAKPGDFILAIDADEKLYNYEYLPVLMDQTRFDVLGITFYHFFNTTQYRVDKAWAPTVSSRLFRFYPGGEFMNRKLASGSEPLYVQELIRQGRAQWNTGLRMAHLGYVLDGDKLMKYNRYMNLDGGNFHSRAHLESIIDPNPVLVDWDGPAVL